MELHHKLRRDPNWHPSGCNICGQRRAVFLPTAKGLYRICLGHQAVNCTNGTINWRQIYGDEAFKLKPAIFPSDVDRAKKERQVDIDALEKQAREFVRANAAKAESVGGGGEKRPREEDGGAGEARPAKAGTATTVDGPPLPDGWAAAKDAQGRTYFWHKATKKVQWDRPTTASVAA